MSNYRPVSLLPVFGKIFEKLIFNKIYSFLDSEKPLNTNQSGFRPLDLFFLSGFSFTETDDSQDSRGREGTSPTPTRSRTIRHLFATLHVRWLSHIFNCTACIYQTATRWDLPSYRITIWLIDQVTLSICLFTGWLAHLVSQFACYTRVIVNASSYPPVSHLKLM